jgi:uncharacterized protein (TIGR00288 family)
MARPIALDNKVAVLIDADNTPFSEIQFILDSAKGYGRVTIKRAYGDWSKENLGKWLEVCNENAIKSIQLNRYVKGKNATDLGMFVDAMDMLHRKDVDIFVLVSSDSDFTSLAQRINEAGLHVIGIGQKNTPRSFTNSCDQFVHLKTEIEQVPKPEKPKEAEKPEKQPPVIKPIEKPVESTNSNPQELLLRAVKQAVDESGIVSGAHLSDILRRIEPTFNLSNYGVARLSAFLARFPDIIKPTSEKRGWILCIR